MEFLIFLKCKRWKIKYDVEKEKNQMADFLRGRKLKEMQMMEERRKNKYEITTGIITQRERRILSEQAILSPYLED